MDRNEINSMKSINTKNKMEISIKIKMKTIWNQMLWNEYRNENKIKINNNANTNNNLKNGTQMFRK